MAYKVYQAKSVENVMNSAIYHLTRMPMTISQLRSKLERKTENQDWIDEVISRLLNIGYLKEDREFAIDFAQNAFSKDKGQEFIKLKLKRKGVTNQIVTDAISQVMQDYNIDESELLSRRMVAYSDFIGISYEQLQNDMSKHGFSSKLVKSAIEEHPLRHQLKTKAQIKGSNTELEPAILKLAKKGKGVKLIKSELRSKFVDVDDFDNVVRDIIESGEFDFYESALHILKKKKYDLTNYNEKSKAYGHLASKGFSGDEIKYAIEELSNNYEN